MLTSPRFKHKKSPKLNSIELHEQEGLARYWTIVVEVASSQHAAGNDGGNLRLHLRIKHNVSSPANEAVAQDMALACRNS